MVEIYNNNNRNQRGKWSGMTSISIRFSLTITGNLIGLDVMAPQGYDAPIMAALGGLFLIGAGGGAIVIGIRRVQREMARVFNDADLHQRRLSDYRSYAFLLVIGLIFVYLCGVQDLI